MTFLDDKGRHLFVTDGISIGKWWFVGYRTATGSTKRLKSIPSQPTFDAAFSALRQYAIEHGFNSYHGETALLRCPFCGRPPLARTASDPSIVGCFDPECQVHPRVSSTCVQTAIARWNKRPY